MRKIGLLQHNVDYVVLVNAANIAAHLIYQQKNLKRIFYDELIIKYIFNITGNCKR